MARLFVSYRRDDSAGHAGRLVDRLKTQFGADRVFIDVDLAPGIDYLEHIKQTIAGCDALIVVIGPQWSQVVNADGRRRLDDPDDLVRAEIEAALARPDTTTIPVLVKGAGMPQSAELPPSIQPLARRNALEISDSRFDYDAGRLVEALRRPAGGRAPRRRATVSVTAAIVTALLAVVAIAYLVLRPGDVVAVPDLVGASSAFHAQGELAEADLRLSPAARNEVRTDVRPGTVIGQTPPAGDRVDRDSEVRIVVAIAPQSVTVPAVVGLTLREAEQKLRRQGLTLGNVSAQPGDSSARIRVQSPAVNDKAPRGTAVDVGFAD